MPNIKIEKIEGLDTSPISFDLSEEDIKSIKGGGYCPLLPKFNCPIKIYVIQISPPPPIDPDAI